MELSAPTLTTPNARAPLRCLRARLATWTRTFAAPRPAGQSALLVLLALGDITALALAFALAYFLRFENPLLPYAHTYSLTFYSSLVFWAIPLWLIVFALQGLYDLDMLFGGTYEYSRVVHACTIGVMILVFSSFISRDDSIEDLSRGWLALAWLSTLGWVMAERFVLRRFVYGLRRNGYFRRRVLILGANPEGQAVADQLRSAPTAGLEVVGFVDSDLPGASATSLGLPILGRVEDLVDLAPRWNIAELIIASTAVSRSQLLETYQAFGLSSTMQLRLSPGLFELLTTGARIKESGYVPLISLNRLRITGVDAWLKSALDYGLILLTLPLTVITFLVIGVLVKRDSPGPVFHRRRVVGTGGRPFDAFKFRTMVANADEVLSQLLAANPELRDEFERNHKLRNDPRVTRMGRFLRRTSLDELPQLINVLLGQMSLVGPRMIAEAEIGRYGQWWMNLLTVKPGISGPWQVMGRSDLPYDERVRLSMKYIRNYSIWTDVQILFQTIGVVVRRQGAY